MAAELARIFNDLPAVNILLAALSLILFLAWVVISRQRTRHLAELIDAVKGNSRRGCTAAARRRSGQ
ncbi:hypothetical protein AB0J82_39135 [Asanoa sp. NPDC049518]|uniref:hypothetical protein n=1 Tax=unclassified Asanoa TaxID=2685164 RepID=UPI003417A9FE